MTGVQTCALPICSLVQAWYKPHVVLHLLDWFDLVHKKFDHRASVRILDLILNNKSVYIYGYHHYTNNNVTICYTYIYSAYTLFFLFLPVSAYPKPRTAFLEEREDDEEPFMNNIVFTCLNWKEILSLTDDYYKVNSFLVEHDTLIYKNFLLPKSLYLCIIRIEIIMAKAYGEEAELQHKEEQGVLITEECARDERKAHNTWRKSTDRKSTRLNCSHITRSRMPSSA